MSVAQQNWAGSYTYTAQDYTQPTTVEQVQELVAGCVSSGRTVKALGSRHSFTDICDTTGLLLDMRGLDAELVIDPEARTATMSGGATYGDITRSLHESGFALATLASLPHISVAGAVSTGTHGSGDRVGSLAAGVSAIELVDGRGELVQLNRGDPDFDGAVVSLGALGVVTRITLDLVPAFDITQRLYTDLSWDSYLPAFDDITTAAYSTSAFTRYGPGGIYQMWLKHRGAGVPGTTVSEGTFHGAPAQTETLHMIPGGLVAAVSEQMGVTGPWWNRLPHFKIDFTPSNGAELQSDYLVPRDRAPEAIEVMRRLHERIDPILQCAEVRTVAADELWLSGAYGRDTVSLHFTWLRDHDAVYDVLPAMEEGLLPLGARPHWGKCFLADAAGLEPLYPRFADFRALRDRLDPNRVFGNAFLSRTVGG